MNECYVCRHFYDKSVKMYIITNREMENGDQALMCEYCKHNGGQSYD